MALILVADADPLLSEVLQQRFRRQGHQALVAHTVHDALNLAERYGPDVIVLNAILPRFAASEVYQRVKAIPSLNGTPVLFYSIEVQVEEEPRALSQNGNSRVRRSTPLSELITRTNSLLRRDRHQQPPMMADHVIAGNLTLHTQNMTVESSGRLSSLTPTEFELLRYLMLHVDEVCSAADLLQNVWGYPRGTGSTDVVRTHVRNLRHKIEDCPARPVHLRTIRHRGYIMCNYKDGENGEDQRAFRADHRE